MKIELHNKDKIHTITLNLCQMDKKTQYKLISRVEQTLKSFVKQHPHFFPVYEEVVSTNHHLSQGSPANLIRYVRKEGVFRGDTILDPETRRITGYQLILLREADSSSSQQTDQEKKELEDLIYELRSAA